MPHPVGAVSRRGGGRDTGQIQVTNSYAPINGNPHLLHLGLRWSVCRGIGRDLHSYASPWGRDDVGICFM